MHPCPRTSFFDCPTTLLVKFSLWAVHRGNRRDRVPRPGVFQFSTFGSTNPISMLCLRVTRRGPGTASRRSAGVRHHLYALPAPGTAQPVSRPNVKTQATTKLTAIEFEGWSRTFSPPDASGSRKSSPARQDHGNRHAVRAAAPTWMPGGQSSRMKNLWFSHVARCIPEQNQTDHRGCRDIKPTSATTSVRTRQRSREVIHADLFTASNASTPFVIRTTRRQF